MSATDCCIHFARFTHLSRKTEWKLTQMMKNKVCCFNNSTDVAACVVIEASSFNVIIVLPTIRSFSSNRLTSCWFCFPIFFVVLFLTDGKENRLQQTFPDCLFLLFTAFYPRSSWYLIKSLPGTLIIRLSSLPLHLYFSAGKILWEKLPACWSAGWPPHFTLRLDLWFADKW